MFDDKQEKEWQAESPDLEGNINGKQGNLKLATVVEEDPNVFKGEPNEGDISPMIPQHKGNKGIPNSSADKGPQ
jgi:hypothetical protein